MARIYITIPKGRNGAWGNSGPQHDENPVGLTPNPIALNQMPKELDGSLLDFAGCSTLLFLDSSSLWQTSQASDISNILGSPVQCELLFHSFPQWSLWAPDRGVPSTRLALWTSLTRRKIHGPFARLSFITPHSEPQVGCLLGMEPHLHKLWLVDAFKDHKLWCGLTPKTPLLWLYFPQICIHTDLGSNIQFPGALFSSNCAFWVSFCATFSFSLCTW